MTWVAVGVAAVTVVGGAIAANNTSKTSQSTSRYVGPQSELEKNAEDTSGEQLGELKKLVDAGPQASDSAAAYGSTKSLADLLGAYSANGGMPSQQDVTSAHSFANQAFAGQQQSLNTQMSEAQMQANRVAGRMGRSANDPILAAKLAQSKMQGQQQLDATKSTFSTQYAQQLSDNRINFAGQQNQVLQGLASQAMQNRQALLSAGNNILAQQQNFRTGNASSNTMQESGGGTGAAIAGGIAGLGTGLSAAASMRSLMATPKKAPATPDADYDPNQA